MSMSGWATSRKAQHRFRLLLRQRQRRREQQNGGKRQQNAEVRKQGGRMKAEG